MVRRITPKNLKEKCWTKKSVQKRSIVKTATEMEK